MKNKTGIFIPYSQTALFMLLPIVIAGLGFLMIPAYQFTESDKVSDADHNEGRLIGRTLMPAGAGIQAIGGPGKEFWAAGQNREIDRGDLTPEQLALMGWGRVVVTPSEERTDDRFLHVIEVGNREHLSGSEPHEVMIPTELLEDGDTVGARLILPDGMEWELRFNLDGNPGGHVKRQGGGMPVLDRPLSNEIQPQKGITGTAEGP